MKRIFVALLLAAAAGQGAAQSDARVVKPEIRKGDSWTYRGTNLLGPDTQEHVSRVSFVDDKVILLVSIRVATDRGKAGHAAGIAGDRAPES